jgi:hypothetical protein
MALVPMVENGQPLPKAIGRHFPLQRSSDRLQTPIVGWVGHFPTILLKGRPFVHHFGIGWPFLAVSLKGRLPFAIWASQSSVIGIARSQ